MKPARRLLLITSDENTAAILQLYLENRGYMVKNIPGGNKGILEARAWQPDAILVSNHVADQPAEQICYDLLNHPLTRRIPLLFLSNVTDRRTRLKVLELGADDVITQPFDVEELQLRIEAAIRLATHQLAA
ncbi:MAG: DNA-binding response regulator [Caldilineae bacterium]|nr:MAG: DNA-binding response regulator [Caldilineae bacterium]